MEIQWYGLTSFSVKTKTGTIVVDPYKAESGLKMPQVKANVVLFSDENNPLNNPEVVSGEPRVFNWPGEYEVSEIAFSMQEFADKDAKSMIIHIYTEGMHICLLSNAAIPVSEELISALGSVDVFLVPVSKDRGGYDKVHTIIEEVEPRIVIPVYFQIDGLKKALDPVEPFMKQAGISSFDAREKFSANAKSELPQEKADFVVLKPQLG